MDPDIPSHLEQSFNINIIREVLAVIRVSYSSVFHATLFFKYFSQVILKVEIKLIFSTLTFYGFGILENGWTASRGYVWWISFTSQHKPSCFSDMQGNLRVSPSRSTRFQPGMTHILFFFSLEELWLVYLFLSLSSFVEFK